MALYPDGVTPLVNLPIRVWSVDKQKMVYRSRTDNEGIFRIPIMRSGRCYIFVGRVRVDLKVLAADESEWTQHHDLVVILPYRMTVAVRPDIFIIPVLMSVIPERPKVVSP